MSGKHNKINAYGAEVVTGLPSPNTLQSRKKRSRLTILAFSCMLIIGLVVFV
ncbi:hypothetical protein ROTO_35670 [Roseovarius tolerans]|uniref:Uncharacterized protein n=2 Tax=Roseovarius tolerans TaxID=74031 RepID=A0A0L6CQF4_9RHOB|nr:hypothetical protein ROTO_35670 [Roseovarius tolerans]